MADLPRGGLPYRGGFLFEVVFFFLVRTFFVTFSALGFDLPGLDVFAIIDGM